MPFEFRTTRRVEFSDTDMAGIMHFSNFFRFMETAEHAFFRSLGFSVDAAKGASLGFGWPRLKAECEYRRPVRFEDEVAIHLLVREIRTRAVRFEYIFSVERHGRAEEVARGSLVVVCVRHDPATNDMKAAPIPPEILARLEVAPAGPRDDSSDAKR